MSGISSGFSRPRLDIVDDLDALMAIPRSRRFLGMLVFVRNASPAAEVALYILEGGIEDENWAVSQDLSANKKLSDPGLFDNNYIPMREGIPKSLAGGLSANNQSFVNGTNIFNGSEQVGFLMRIKFFHIESDDPNGVLIQVRMRYSANHTDIIFRGRVSSSSPVRLVNPGICPGYVSGLASYGSLQVILDQDLDNYTGSITVSVSYDRITDDRNMLAQHTYLQIGDSISAGTAGGDYLASQLYPWKIRDFYGYEKCRLINKSIGGNTSTHVETSRLGGLYDIENPTLIIWALGTNDVSGGFDAGKQSTYLANAEKFINWTVARYPSAHLIMCGPPPAQNVITEDDLSIARTIVSGAVTAANNSRVHYVNLGMAFNPVDLANFNQSEIGGGNSVHLSTDGHSAVYSTLETFLSTYIPTLGT